MKRFDSAKWITENKHGKALNEENFDNISFDNKLADAMGMSSDEFEDQVASRGVGDSFGSAGTDKRSGQVIGDILQLIKSTDIDPMDVMEEIGVEFKIKFEFSGGAPGFKQADNGDELGSAMARTQDDARDYNSERDFLPMQEHTVTFTKDDMKKTELRKLIRESIKGLVNEQSGFQTTIQCPSGFTVKQLNSTIPQVQVQNMPVATYTLKMGDEICYTCVPPDIFQKHNRE